MSIAEPPEVTIVDTETRVAAVEAVEKAKARGWTQAEVRAWFEERGVTLSDYLAAKRGEQVTQQVQGVMAMLSIVGLPPMRPTPEDTYPDIPASMKAARRWLLWRLEPNEDPAKKPRKVPLYVSGERRSGTLDGPEDTDRLATYAEACTALTARHAGLGFALGPDGDLCWQGIDLDNLDQHPGLQFVADDLPGYTERSPSGGGVHAIGYGRAFPSLGSNTTGIEAYARGRFFTVTGESVGMGDVTDLADFVQGRLAPLHDHRPQDTSAPIAASGGSLAGSLAVRDIRSALASMRSDDRDLWVRMGHALKSLGEAGRGLWLEWSQTSPKYDAADAARVWDSFKPDHTSYQAVFAEAQRQGWANPGAGRPSEGVREEAPAGSPDAAPAFDPWERYIVPKFPLDLLPATVRTFVQYLSLTTGADPAACAMGALAACSGALDQRFTLKMKRTGNWQVRPRLWTMLVGDPSTKKTPLISSCVAPLRTYENKVVARYQSDMARWKAEPKDERGDEPASPTRFIFNDITTEKMGEMLSRQDRGALFENDEMSGWIGAMDKYSGGKGSSADRSFWAKAYNGGPITVDRLGRGETYVQNLCLAVLGAIQPDRLPEVGKLTSDGLLQRFLPVMMRRAHYPQEAASDVPYEGYAGLVQFLIDMRPAGLLMDEGARGAAEEFQRFIFGLESMEGLGKSFCTFAGKLTGVHGSLSLLLHLIEDPANAVYEPVSERVVRAAARILTEFTLPHAMELYRSTTDGADWEAIQTLASFILTSAKDRFRPSDFTNGVRSLAGLDTWSLAQKISPMVAGGWLNEELVSGQIKAWTIVPGLRETLAERRETELRRKAAVFKTLKNLTEGTDDEKA